MNLMLIRPFILRNMGSDKFTIADSYECARIHQIRYENYKKTKHMSPEELIENTRLQAKTVNL